MITIQGKGVSAGVGVGPLYFYRRATAEIKRYTVEDTDAEWHRFKGAQTGAVEQLGDLAEQARREAGDEAAMLFETHQMMAEDLDYEEAIEDRILNQKMNAEAAVSDTADQFAEMFASMDDAYMQARAADVKDVSQRILSILCGIVQGGIASDVPVLPSAMAARPSYSGLSASPMPTMAGIPIVRARMAVWLEPEPPAVIKPRILVLSSWIVSDGARSSAQSSTGTSDAMPPCTMPHRMPRMRWLTSLTSAARACI